MRRDLGSIFKDLSVIKTKELEECNKELENEHYNNLVKKALLFYKHELLENLEMYDHYLEEKKEPIL